MDFGERGAFGRVNDVDADGMSRDGIERRLEVRANPSARVHGRPYLAVELLQFPLLHAARMSAALLLNSDTGERRLVREINAQQVSI